MQTRKIVAVVAILVSAWGSYQFLLGVLAGIRDARAASLTREAVDLQAAGRFADSLPKTLEVVRLIPGSAIAHYNLGVTQMNLGDLAGAEASYRGAIALDRSHADSWCNLGNVLLSDAGRLDEAAEATRTAIGLNPTDVQPRINLCAILIRALDVDAAVDAGRNAVELAPENAVAHQNLGVALVQKKELVEAVRELERSVKLNPKASPAWYGLTVAYCTQEDAQGAWEAIRRARENGAAESIPENIVTAVQEAIGAREE